MDWRTQRVRHHEATEHNGCITFHHVWGVGGGREARDGGDTCTHGADSLRYTQKLTILWSNYTPIKKKSCVSEVSLCWNLLVYVHVYLHASNMNLTFLLSLTSQAGMLRGEGQSILHSSQFSWYYHSFWASQVALVVKNLPANARDIREVGLIHGLGRSPGGGQGNPLQYSCLENPHGQRSLGGLRSIGHIELDTTDVT